MAEVGWDGCSTEKAKEHSRMHESRLLSNYKKPPAKTMDLIKMSKSMMEEGAELRERVKRQ